jgi:hypothetical protein
MGAIDSTNLLKTVLRLINAVRVEAGDRRLASIPRASLSDPDFECPVARALSALVLPDEQRLVFSRPWYAAAATKAWGVPFRDTLLSSVAMPAAIYEFAIKFREGKFPELLETPP